MTPRGGRAARIAAAIVAFGVMVGRPAVATFTSNLQPTGTLSVGSVNPVPVTKLHVKACAAGVVGSASLTWIASAAPGLAGYDVFRGTTQLTTSLLSSTATSYTDPLLITLGGSYTYTVRAYVGAAAIWYADKSVTVQIPLLGCNNVTVN